MTLRRFMIDLPVPEDAFGNLHMDLQKKPTTAQLQAMANMTWLQIILTMIQRLKNYAVNLSQTGEIMRAKVHKCHHDVIPPLPCEEEQDI